MIKYLLALKILSGSWGECGPKRLLFGTDFPVQTHEDSILLIEESMKTYSDQDKQDVYHDNAARILQ